MAKVFDLRFLESAENVRRAIASAIGREPNAGVAKGISVCLQQGRMFFEAASEAPLEIRPLLLYYGMMAFAKAVACGRTLQSLATLKQGHGLRDISAQDARLEDLKLKVEGRGTFQEFNDRACTFEGVTYYQSFMRQKHPLPTAGSARLDLLELGLRDILARVTALQGLYKETFREESKSLRFSIQVSGTPTDQVFLGVQLDQQYQNRESLRLLVEGIRANYRCLRRWRLHRASKAWDQTFLNFINVAPPANEFSEAALRATNPDTFDVVLAGQPEYLNFHGILDPVVGATTPSYQALSQPVGQLFISEASLQYMGMFLLSSLVRYRPQIWVHSVSRYASADRPADDQALSLIHQFMDGVQGTYPSLVTELLTEQ